jgi:hypothetical protein
MTVVCGDSHTSTHGAFGALAHGIGTSEVEHVLATQTLLAKKAKNMLVKVEGTPAARLHRQGHRAGHHRPHRHRRRHRLHHRVRRQRDPRAQHGRPHDGVQHGHRGRRARRPGGGGRQDASYVQGPALRAQRRGRWEQAVAHWRTLHSDPGAHFDAVVEIDATADAPAGHLGHEPGDGAVDRGPRARPRQGEGRRQARRHRARAGLHGPGAEQAHRPTSASTRSSSAAAPTAASRTCAKRRRGAQAPAAAWRPTSRWRWWCRARAW